MSPPNRPGEATGGIGAGGLLLVARALACSVEVFLHKKSTFGERYLGLQAGLALLIILVFPMFTPALDPRPLWWYLGLFTFRCILINGHTAKRRKRGDLGPHSFYTGTPVLGSGRAEIATKRIVEPALVWITSAAACERWPVLSSYLAIAGLGLFMTVNLAAAAERKRLLDMHDAYMEQRRAAEDWRSMHQ